MQPGGAAGFNLSGMQSTLGQVFAGLQNATANMQRAALNIGGLQPVVNQLGSSIRSLIQTMDKQAVERLPTAKAASAAYGSGLSGLSTGAAAAGIGAITAAVTGVVSSVKNAITTVIDALEMGFVKMKSIVLETVGAFRPFEVEMFNRAVKDLQAVFGTIFLPILQKVTVYVRQLADYFYSLPPAFKDTIASVGKLTLVFGSVGVVLGGLVVAFDLLLPIVTALIAVFTALNAVFLPIAIILGPILIPIGVALAAVAAGFALVAATAGALIAFNWKGIVKTFEQVWAAIETTGQAVWDSIKPVWDELKFAFSELSDQLGELFEAFKPLLGAGLLVIALVVKAALTLIIEGLKLFVNALTGVASMLNSLLRAIGLTGLGFALPDVSRGNKSAFGLGQHGGSVTDPMSAFKAVQEDVLKFSQAKGEEPEDKVGNIATYTKNISDKMDIVADYVQNTKNEGGEFLRKGPIRYALGKIF